ncbi:hypothetical protein [Chryseobacterium indoltheticum]|uniref:hypothetical protein n=1 Tax=Chryseobacterium indoltheticum TaxID=254 RepID=UPI0028E34BA8|nr:hypothetical protein [Chryseobacterium indoltheticum]
MKTKPILFSTEMVEANLAGRKTNTRRIVEDIHTGFLEWAFKEKKNLAGWIFTHAKYQMGDIVWVRETFIDVDQKAEKYFNGVRFHYKADKTFVGCWPWKPSIHMPKEAARQFIKILSVKVQRLQDISKSDSIEEGILPLTMSSAQLIEMGQLYFDYSKPADLLNDGLDPVCSFKSLWQKINGEGSWNKNPFVWVYEYEIIEKPENFLT